MDIDYEYYGECIGTLVEHGKLSDNLKIRSAALHVEQINNQALAEHEAKVAEMELDNDNAG